MCEINGYLNVYPLRKKVGFQSSYDELETYTFGDKTRLHKFCRECGTSLLIEFGEVEDGVVRPLLAVNIWSIP